MANYRGTASGADLDRVPEMISEISTLKENIEQLKQELEGVDALIGAGVIDDGN